MQATLEVVNWPQFQDTLRKYLAVSEREFSNALNKKMFFIARGASRNTPKVDRSKVEAELGVVAYKISKNKKTGKFKRRKAIMGTGATLAHLVVNARRGRANKPGLYGKAMAKAVGKMVGKRMRGIGTLKAGWWEIIRKFASSVGESSSRDVSFSRVKGRPYMRIAKPGPNPSCSFDYNVNSYDTKHNKYMDARTQNGLAAAFNAEIRSMNEEINKRLYLQAQRLKMP